MVHNLVSDLIVVLDVDSPILEDSVLHLHVVEQTVLGVEAVEEGIFVDNGLTLARNISVVLWPSTCLSESDNALA